VFVTSSLSHRDTQLLPSPLIGKAIPEFTLNKLDLNGSEKQTTVISSSISDKTYQNQKWILNVWASWCAACQNEHPIFVEIGDKTPWLLVGLNYKDQSDDARKWLGKHGNPYTDIIHDIEGDLGLNLGVYGVPETFLIDEQGIIRYKHVGPICGEIVKSVFVPFFSNQPMDFTTDCNR